MVHCLREKSTICVCTLIFNFLVNLLGFWLGGWGSIDIVEVSVFLLYEGLISVTDMYSGGITNFPLNVKKKYVYGFRNTIFNGFFYKLIIYVICY